MGGVAWVWRSRRAKLQKVLEAGGVPVLGRRQPCRAPYRRSEVLSWYLTVPACAARPGACPSAQSPPSPPPPKAPSLTGWGHSAAEVRSLFEGQIINPTK